MAKTEFLLEKELNHVLAALTPSNELVVRVMLRTGLRVGDVLSLKPQQLANRMWITESKTKKRRQVGLGNELLAALRVNSGVHWVFPSRKCPTQHRTRQAVWADVKRASRAFRLRQNIGTHSMRKVYAVELLEKYGDIERVQKALQHDNQAVTMIYAMADKLMKKRGR